MHHYSISCFSLSVTLCSILIAQRVVHLLMLCGKYLMLYYTGCRGEWDEGKRLIGRRVFVDGYGEGIVTDYSKKTLGLIGSSTHSIDFNTPGSGNDPGLIMTVKLQRKGSNRGALWLVWPGESEAAQRVANLQKQKHQRDEAGRRTSGGSQSGLGSWSPSNFPGSVNYTLPTTLLRRRSDKICT